MEPCVVCGNWFPYMDIKTTSCGHLHHPNCLCVHLQDSTHCKKYGQFLHPLWFDNKGIRCMEKEEYDKQKLALGLDDEVKIWLEHHQIVAIYVGEPIWLCSSSFAFICFTSFLFSCACDSWVVCCLCNWCIHVSYCVESMINVVLIQSKCKLYSSD